MLVPPSPQAKAAATRARNKSAADFKLQQNLAIVRRSVEAAINQCSDPQHFLQNGDGVSCFVWYVAEVNDGRKVRHVRDCVSANSLVLDEKFDKAMYGLPCIVSYHINID